MNAALEKAVGFSVPPVLYSDDISAVIPKLLAASLEFDLSEKAVPESEWTEALEYLDRCRKSKRRY